jgi:hypothetical protein
MATRPILGDPTTTRFQPSTTQHKLNWDKMGMMTVSRRAIRGVVPSLIQSLLNQFGPDASVIRTVTGEHVSNHSVTWITANQMD